MESVEDIENQCDQRDPIASRWDMFHSIITSQIVTAANCRVSDPQFVDEGKNLLILDSADGISKICIFKDLSKLETNTIYSMHDFDIALTLKLLKKIRKIESATIIAIPKKYNLKKAVVEVEQIILSIKFYLSTALSKS